MYTLYIYILIPIFDCRTNWNVFMLHDLARKEVKYDFGQNDQISIGKAGRERYVESYLGVKETILESCFTVKLLTFGLYS